MNDSGNVVKFHRKVQFNIGFVISLIILAYVVFHIFSYMTKTIVTVYEVNEGSITTDNRFRAMALREEKLVTSEREGSVIYFTENKSRVGVKSLVCSLDTSGEIAALLSGEGTVKEALSGDDLKEAETTVSEFVSGFEPLHFSETYPFKNSLHENLQTAYSRRTAEENAAQLQQATASGTFLSFYAASPGLLVLSGDGYEDVTSENFTAGQFSDPDYSNQIYYSDRVVEPGEPVYKLITDENWQIVMPISDDTYAAIADYSYIDVKFDPDGKEVTGAVSFAERTGEKYLILSFDDSMERYADYRFLNVTLMLSRGRGLKIPNSSIVTKKFFGIPKEYFVKGGDSNAEGVLVYRDDGKVEFVVPTVYYESDTERFTDGEKLKAGDKLQRTDSAENFIVGTDIEEKEGVYNVNKGYAIFKLINKSYQNADYSIVEEGTPYGIALYDHIVLQGDSVEEDSLIY